MRKTSNMGIEMKKICIATLTHDDVNRDLFLEKTVESFVSTVLFDKIDWFFLINGNSKKLLDTLNKLKAKYSDKINFIIELNKKNLGPGPGINRLNKLTKHYEYTLFIEGDWAALPQKTTGIPNTWFKSLIKYMDINQHIDNFFLRRYINDTEVRTTGYTDWTLSENIVKQEQTDGLTIIELKKREYTNNPTLRRNSSYYKVGIFPLQEFFDENKEPLEIKGNSEWGLAESNVMSLGNELKTSFILFGIFVHIDDIIRVNPELNLEDIKDTGCKLYPKIGSTSCKYGFLYPNEDYCKSCNHSADYTDLALHDTRFQNDLT